MIYRNPHCFGGKLLMHNPVFTEVGDTILSLIVTDFVKLQLKGNYLVQ